MNLPEPTLWSRLSPLLDELLELDEAQRMRRLSALRQDDATLADELEGLMRDARRMNTSAFLAGQAAATAAPVPEPGLAGWQLGAYVLQRPLGQGGSGSVWRAQRQGPGAPREVAIKLLHLSLVGHAAAERFQREGAILGRLAHPNIAALLDSGLTAGGQPYLVIELVEGEPIDAHCQHQRLGIEARLRLFLEVLAAVGMAHRHLVVHRDIKPSNVLVTAAGNVKLLDFGIAKLIDDHEGSGNPTELTRMGGRALTPAYAAPEQFTGTPVSTATDVYALGVLLFKLLVGRHPFAGAADGAARKPRKPQEIEPRRLSRALTATAAEAGAEPSAESLADERLCSVAALRRRLEGDLDTIVAHMLRASPAERYTTVEAVADDIRRHLAHEPVSVQPDAWRYRLGKFARRHRGAVVAGSLVAAAIAAGAFGTLSQSHRARQLAGLAQSERDRAVRELIQAEAANEFTHYLLDEGWYRPQSSLDLLGRASQLVRSQYAQDPMLRARLQTMLASVYTTAGEGQRANALLEEAERSARESGDPPTLAAVQCAQGVARIDSLDLDSARQRYREALGVLRPLAAQHTSDLIRCLIGLSHVESSLALDPQTSLALADEALAWLQTPRPGQRQLLQDARLARAEALSLSQRTAEAVAIYESVHRELSALGRGRTIQAQTLLSSLSGLLAQEGQFRRAAEVQARANEIDRELRGTHAESATSLGNLATYLLETGQTESARPLFEAALAKAARDNDPALGAIYSLSLARLWCQAGDLPRCRGLLDSARRILEPLLPEGHPRRANIALVQADLAAAAGEHALERDFLQRAAQLQQAVRGAPGPRPSVLARLALANLRLGELDLARTQVDQAIAAARSELKGFSHSRALGQALYVQGRLQAARGEPGAMQSWQLAAEQLDATVGPQAALSLAVVASLRSAGP